MLIHVREIHLKNRSGHSNKHERLDGEFRDRVKAVCGFGAEGPVLVRLMIVHHDFFCPCGGIGKTMPAEAQRGSSYPERTDRQTDRQITLSAIQQQHTQPTDPDAMDVSALLPMQVMAMTGIAHHNEAGTPQKIMI